MLYNSHKVGEIIACEVQTEFYGLCLYFTSTSLPNLPLQEGRADTDWEFEVILTVNRR